MPDLTSPPGAEPVPGHAVPVPDGSDGSASDGQRPRPLQAVVAEDQALLRVGLVRILEAGGITVVAAVADAAGLAEALARDDIDIAIVDVRLPPTHTTEGLEAAIRARQARRAVGAVGEGPGPAGETASAERSSEPAAPPVPAVLPVLVLSQWVEPLYARDLLASGAGAVGYLLKDRVADVDEFLAAVRQVASGGTVLDPEVVARLVSRRERPLDRLTVRERDVLTLMAQGRSNAAIAAQLVITDKAVGKHTNSIFTKLDLPPAADDNRRVLAVLTWLNSANP
ncbi:DNA-binding response regulator, NarL/FixJ family, contains REC and HTH domains [Parafrankia irregularis]|uniref:DNA-binding response regulator, NarL/FixJ family, contains REC and HTH domains n=1 Tax=Parafrankia irregularis TaxID=795642 RepID=A0A0S4R171_9ACTN|nr:DNA-binding response regulator, NarL/FixJ family, contains REC and HTH domains [Parafrankia irregularis]